jgi:hypothetical protein
MKNSLTSATKKRIIWELKRILYEHPRYRSDSENVKNKFSFEERPQRGVIVNGTSADRVRLSANNYVARLKSFLVQLPVKNHFGTSLEWVKENQLYLEKVSPTRSIFPSPPGVYLLKITSLPDEPRNIPGTFILEPNLTVTDEPIIQFSTSSDLIGQLSRENVYPGSIQLWIDGKHPLSYGVDYTADYNSGEIIFLKSTPVGSTIFADYRYKIENQGPFQFKAETTNLTAIPGAVLAFGDRVQECDEIEIVVTESRTEVADIYGGKFEVHFDLIVFSRDAEDREKLSDYIVAKILERQNYWGFEGIELIDVAPGGESEEIYNEELDAYYYDGAISLSMRVDWEIYIPLPITSTQVEPISKTEEQNKGFLDGSYIWDQLRVTDDSSQIAGMSIVIGRDIGYSHVK